MILVLIGAIVFWVAMGISSILTVGVVAWCLRWLFMGSRRNLALLVLFLGSLAGLFTLAIGFAILFFAGPVTKPIPWYFYALWFGAGFGPIGTTTVALGLGYLGARALYDRFIGKAKKTTPAKDDPA